MKTKASKFRSAVPKSYSDEPEVRIALMEGAPEGAAPIVEDLQEEIVTAHRAGRALSVALVRIRRAEPAASEELARKTTRRLLQIVSKNLRHSDKCGLISEEEILAILPGADEKGCRIAVDRLMSASFEKITESLGIEAPILVAELGEAEGGVVAFLDRIRQEGGEPSAAAA